ncbi:MAG: hypothetical protein ABMB14_20445 [Myxococcota bacterium]
MELFAPLIAHLERVLPGVYRFAPASRGRADGLRIDRPGFDGHAFVYPPEPDGSLLVSLSDLGEVFQVPTIDEVAPVLQRWAFPATWTAPGPVDPAATRASLAALVAGLGQRAVAVDVDPGVAEAADPRRLTWNFPADPDGRLRLGAQVVLAEPEPAKSLVARTVALVATGPERRRDPQRIHVGWRAMILANQDHRWADAPWLWTGAPVPPEERDPPGPDGAAALAAFDAGELEAGLAVFGVTLSPELHAVLGGARIRPPACCAYVDARWTSRLVEVIRAAAPWALTAAVQGGGKKVPVRPIAQFPGQRHARKASIAVTRGPDGLARLVIEVTAANARLPERAWRRPLAMELRRWGLEP